MQTTIEIKNEEERKVEASQALHNILTFLWGYDSRIFADNEAWIVFHNLIIFISMRNDFSREELTFKLFTFSGGIIPILEKKAKEGNKLVRDPAVVFHDYMTLAGWSIDAHPDNGNEGLLRIVKAYRKHRNKLLMEIDHPFSHLLIKTNLEVDGPYYEAQGNEYARNGLELTTDLLKGHEVQNLQFETGSAVTADEVENHLFEYFKAKVYEISGNPMNTAQIYDAEGTLVWNTSVTVTEGLRNSIVMVSLTKPID